MCHQGDIAQGALVILSGIASRPCICTINHLGSCDVGIKAFFFLHYMTQITLLSNRLIPSVIILLESREQTKLMSEYIYIVSEKVAL